MQGLGIIDLGIVVAYIGGLVLLARMLAQPQGDSEDFFLGGRKIPWWAAACSFVATAVSAASLVAIPAKGASSDLRVVGQLLGGFIAAAIIARFFIPVWYRSGSQTIYGFLDDRLGAGSGKAASVAFIGGRLLASGGRLFIGGLALAWLVAPWAKGNDVSIIIAIVALTVAGTSLARIGGIRSVIWTDVVQALTIVLVSGTIIAVLWAMIPPETTWSELMTKPDGETSRLNLYTGFFNNWGDAFSFLAVAIGWSVFYLGPYGTDQDLAQRLLTCPSPQKGSMSLIMGIALGGVLTLILGFMGILIGAAGAMPEALASKDATYPAFISEYLPTGLAGLAAASLCAAAISGLTSETNALASVVANNIWKDEKNRLKWGKRLTFVAGGALAAVAILCITLRRAIGGDLFDFVMMIMIYSYGGLLGVFTTALFFRGRGNLKSTIWALVTGLLVATVGLGGLIPNTLATVINVLIDSSGIHADSLSFLDSFIGKGPAFPWIMVIATIVSTAVCSLGKRNK